MERFLKTHQMGDLYTPDPREDSLSQKSEVFRLLYGSQALGYLDLFASTGRYGFLREATDRLELLLSIGDIWSGKEWDGDLGYAFLRAYEYTGDPRFLETGLVVARRLAQLCSIKTPCALNTGLNTAICLAQAERVTKERQFLEVARPILARTQGWQHADGSFPHQYSPDSRNLLYSSWQAFQLMEYLRLDPEVRDAQVSAAMPSGQAVILDFDLMMSRLASLLGRQLNDDGTVLYSGGWTYDTWLDPDCVYCSNPLFQQCKSYCETRCGSSSGGHPCSCIEDPLTDCQGGKPTGTNPDTGEYDPLCAYCSSAMYLRCADSCRVICGTSSEAFPCGCITDAQTECPRDTAWREITYYDEWDPNYDTRGWTSELASTAFGLAGAGRLPEKWRVLDFLFSLQNQDGSFPDKWGYRTEKPGTRLYIWAESEHSVMRTSIIFRVLASLLVPTPVPEAVELQASSSGAEINLSARMSALSSVFPNPSASGMTVRFNLPPGAGQAELVILDVAGRVVKRLPQVQGGSPSASVIWDGTDDDGAPVAPGVYFAQVIGDSWRSAKKLVILAQ